MTSKESIAKTTAGLAVLTFAARLVSRRNVPLSKLLQMSPVYGEVISDTVITPAAESKAKMIGKLVARILGTGLSGCLAWYLTFLIHYKYNQSKKMLPLAPGPLPLPIIGSLHLMAQEFSPDGNPAVHRVLMKIGKKYKGLFGLYLGSVYTLVITHPAVAEEAYTVHPNSRGYEPRGLNSTDRARLQSHGGHHVQTMNMFTRDGQGIAMSTGPYWVKVRGRLVASITNKRIAEKNDYIVKEEVESVIREWARKINRGERIDNLTEQLKRESLNIAFRMLFSKRFGSTPEKDLLNIEHLISYFFHNLASGNPADVMPIFKYFPTKFLGEFKENVDLRDEIIKRIVGERRASWDKLRAEGKMSSRSDARDICDMFLFDQVDGFEQKNPETGKHEKVHLTQDEVEICMFDIMFAFGDTTATTNEIFIYYMINNPDVQRKVHEELDRVVGPNRLPNLDDREHLPYFWATLKEVFRISLVSPLMAPHYAVEDMTLHDTDGKEYFVPQGTSMFMHGFSMALDPELWDNPLEFNPDRWFKPRNKGLGLYGQEKRAETEHYKFIPFSLGPRMCPGYAFAKVAQFIQTATIMHCFKWKLAEDARTLPNADKVIINGKLDERENFGLSNFPQRHGENGFVSAEIRPAARLCSHKEGDFDRNNVFLKKDVPQNVRLCKKIPLSHDTALLRFAFPESTQVLGLPVGKHFKIVMPNIDGHEQGKWNGKPDAELGKSLITRSYTPTSCDDDVGYVDMVVKFYMPREKRQFPDGGKTTQQLANLYIGDHIAIQGPFGRVEYKGRGQFKVGSKTLNKKYIGMMAGGSGLTPMLQVIEAALKDPEDETLFSLLYANQTEEDILLRDRLDLLQCENPNRFKVHYTLDRPTEDWKYSSGFITAEMIKSHLPPPSDDTAILMCGPPPMIKFACRANLDKLGYAKEIQIEF